MPISQDPRDRRLAGSVSLQRRQVPRNQTSKVLPVPDDELTFQFGHQSHFKNTWMQIARPVVTLRWNIGRSRVFSAQQKAMIVSSLRAMVNSQGELRLKTARFPDLERNVEDLKNKLFVLIMASLMANKSRRSRAI